jgi:hypothetical protein
VVHHSFIPEIGRQRQVNSWVRGQPGLQSEFQDSQGYTEKPCLKKTKTKTKTKKTQTNKQKVLLRTIQHMLLCLTHFDLKQSLFLQGYQIIEFHFKFWSAFLTAGESWEKANKYLHNFR